MKKVSIISKVISIAIALLFTYSLTLAQTYEINDGAIVNLQCSSTPYNSLTITSTTANNTSTAIFQMQINGSDRTVTFGSGSILTDYYGLIRVPDGLTFDLQSSSSRSIPAKFTVNGSTETTTLKISATASGLSLTGYDGSNRTINLENYGILDLSGSTNDFTISNNIYFNGYTTNAPYIKYIPSGSLSTTLPKIIISGTNSTISSNGTSNALYASKHFMIDLTNASASGVSTTAYPLIQLTDVSLPPTINGSDLIPTITGNGNSAWTIGNMTVTNPSGSTYNVNLVVAWNPGFQFDATVGGYTDSWNSLIVGATAGIVDSPNYLQVLRKNKTSIGNSTISNNLSIDLGSYTLAGSGQTITISSNKSLALKKGSGGYFDGQLQFASTTSALVFLGTGVTDAILGSNYSSSASGSYGFLQIGDGTTTASCTLSLSGTKITTSNKFSKVVIKNGATLTITQ